MCPLLWLLQEEEDKGGGGGGGRRGRRRRNRRRRRRNRRRGEEEEEEEEERGKKRRECIDFSVLLSLYLPFKRAQIQRGIAHSGSGKAKFSPAAPETEKQGEKGH